MQHKSEIQDQDKVKSSLIDLDSDGELRAPLRIPKPDGERKRTMRRRHRYRASTRYRPNRFARQIKSDSKGQGRQPSRLPWNAIGLLVVITGAVSLVSIPCAIMIAVIGIGVALALKVSR